MSKYVYPIILHPEKGGGYSVDVPDLEIGTQGETVAECIDMARDAIGLWGICQQDDRRTIPEPARLTPACTENEIVTLVDVDFDAYGTEKRDTTVLAVQSGRILRSEFLSSPPRRLKGTTQCNRPIKIVLGAIRGLPFCHHAEISPSIS